MAMYKTFDYLCPNCNNVEEIFSKNHEEDKMCSKCETVMQRQITMPAFTLKGDGFYSTGTFSKSKDGPKLDQDLLNLSDRELNIECGLPADCA